MGRKKVFVSGCFDLLHSGHVTFFKTAAEYGDVYVGVGSDATIWELKNRKPVNGEDERLYMVKSVRYVRDAWISSGSGQIDFEPEIRRLMPDILLVNADGHARGKQALCAELGIEYVVLERLTDQGLPPHSSTEIRANVPSQLPYRVEIAGGWLDLPLFSQICGGCVICASIEPTREFFDRGGMSTSTRRALAELFHHQLPMIRSETLAKLAFRYDNGIDLEKPSVSGAQDSIGICMPGITLQHYNGKYWPEKIETILEEETLRWLEETIALYPLWPRRSGYDPYVGMSVTPEGVGMLTQASALCREGIQRRDAALLARGIHQNRLAGQELLPAMFTREVLEAVAPIQERCAAWKFTGAGGGGYLVLVSPRDVQGAIRVKIRRRQGD